MWCGEGLWGVPGVWGWLLQGDSPRLSALGLGDRFRGVVVASSVRWGQPGYAAESVR